MKLPLVPFFLLVFIYADVYGQAQFQNSGNWHTVGNWAGNNIGDAVTETVTFNNSVSATIISGKSYTVGAITFGNSDVLNVNSGGSLNVGDASHPVDLDAGNSTQINVAGTLIIWGDLEVNNSIFWNITGTVIIKGNVNLGNSAAISVSGGGTLQVGGDFGSGNSTAVSISSPSSITVTGDVDVGNSSTVSGCAGCFHAGGTCTGPNSFCNSSVLPIKLTGFTGVAQESSIILSWITTEEVNFDKFAIERMIEKNEFAEIGQVPGTGSGQQIISYSFEDKMPNAGANYYRLRSIDRDGKFEFSDVVKVEFAAGDRVTVVPNPVTDGAFDVHVNFAKQGSDKILVYNNVGLLVKDLTSLTPGFYTLYYISDDKRCATRFVVK